MKVLSIRGTKHEVTFETDEGIFIGQGEILERGFMVYKNCLKDINNIPVNREKRDEIIVAIAKYLHGKPDPAQFFFEN